MNLRKDPIARQLQGHLYMRYADRKTQITEPSQREREGGRYRLIGGLKGVRADYIALHAMEAEPERVVLHSPDFVRDSLRRFHSSLLFSSDPSTANNRDSDLGVRTSTSSLWPSPGFSLKQERRVSRIERSQASLVGPIMGLNGPQSPFILPNGCLVKPIYQPIS